MEILNGKRFYYILGGIIALLTLFAFYHPKLVDDAFISFRYAKNLVEGNGLVFNPGERVEGYTNFLWVIFMAGGLLIGVQPEHFAIYLSIPIYIGCLVLTYLLALKILKRRTLSLIVMTLVGTNWTVASFATSGLETPLQLLEFLTVAYVISLGTEKGWNWQRTLALSVVLNIAILTRPDAVIIAVIALVYYYKTHNNIRLKEIIIIAVPFLLIAFPYLIWKITYYKSLFPNSFQAKVHGLSGITYGLFYVYLFCLCYLLFPYVILLIAKWKNLVRSNHTIGFCTVSLLSWVIYIIVIGGDFMEFRFFVPVIPLLMILIVYVIETGIPGKTLKYGLIAGLFLGTLNTSLAFDKPIGGWGTQNVETLSRPLTGSKENWIGIGKRLGELFGGTGVTIALGAAGAIPYYSGLRTIDMMGINDANIPIIGNELSVMAGHRVIAPLSYLYNREVNLVFWPNNFTFDEVTFRHWVKNVKWENIYRYYLDVDKQINGMIVNEAHLIGIPINDDLITVAWYLTPNEAVDEVIRDENLYRILLVRNKQVSK
ncbi:MAG: hypothetical protein P9X24_12710 [Candidatus Hatepunaea meridiana]|nr:hypothetical protein [Candidatus Hatepunaea meridiana]